MYNLCSSCSNSIVHDIKSTLPTSGIILNPKVQNHKLVNSKLNLIKILEAFTSTSSAQTITWLEGKIKYPISEGLARVFQCNPKTKTNGNSIALAKKVYARTVFSFAAKHNLGFGSSISSLRFRRLLMYVHTEDAVCFADTKQRCELNEIIITI